LENNLKNQAYKKSLNSIIRVYKALLKNGKINYYGPGFRRMIELEIKLKE
tara:strand:+ start:915 stop:1064 length:150 start_codon:yes stop_codon:yes gene_type:complete